MPMTSSRCGWPCSVERLAELPGELPVQEVEREVGGDIGELGHRLDDLGQRCEAADVAHDQGRHDALAQLAQGAFQVLLGSGAAAARKAPIRSAVSGRSACSSSQARLPGVRPAADAGSGCAPSLPAAPRRDRAAVCRWGHWSCSSFLHLVGSRIGRRATGAEARRQSRYNGAFADSTGYPDILVTRTDCWQKSLRAGPF
jgi:hypothetical protein